MENKYKIPMRKTFFLLALTSLFSQLVIAQNALTCNNPIYIRNDSKTDISKITTADKYRLIEKLDSSCNEHKIIKDSADYFLIVPFYDMTYQLKPIWLKKTDLIRINIGASKGKLLLYSTADTNSKPAHDFDIDKEKIFDKSVVILNCKTGWYKIELKLKGKSYVGWAKREGLCPNPCSTCG
jgi:hypothetical protein